MAAGRWDITLEVGASFDRTLTFRDGAGDLVDFTGASAAAAIKATDGTELLSLTTGNGRLILGGAAGTLRVLLDDDATASLESAVDDGARWDGFVRFDAATVWKVWRGTVRLEPRLTTSVP